MLRPHRSVHLVITGLTVISLLLGSVLPVAAQEGSDGSRIFLPLTANNSNSNDGQTSPPGTDGVVYRTHVTVPTAAMWRDLVRLEVTVLERGEDWALVLVDDVQLEDLARLRFNPEATNALTTLRTAAGGDKEAAAVFGALLAAAGAVHEVGAARDSGVVAAARMELRTAMRSLSAQQQALLAAVNGVDTDGDGLTDDQENFWCTSPTLADSDYDGSSDGAEVRALKDWMNHRLAGPPLGTAQPFNGWPFDATNCVDNDRDSIPNLAERWEIGTNMNLESTDRDRYDDGQELYGTTYCPGSGSACGYGQLPSANHDGILLFPQLPAWVTAAGNHPLVAAFPKIEINLVPDANGKVFQVRLATVITTDERHEEGESKSYSTTKTEGTSTANSETETWEDWQETSRTSEATAAVQSSSVTAAKNSTVNIVQSSNINTTNVVQSVTEMTVNMTKAAKSIPQVYIGTKAVETADFALGEACAEVHCKRYAGAAVRTAVRTAMNLPDIIQKNVVSNQCANDLLGKLKCAWSGLTNSVKQTWDEKLDAATKAEQEAQGVEGGTNYSTGGGMMDAQKVYPISYPMPSFVPTITETSGSSRGGARTTTHTTYEEHSVTEGQTKQFGKSWGTATAQDSAHAADLWFAYEVRNGGSDYARQICNLAFNVYIGSDAAPAATYFPAADLGGSGCLSNFRPGEAHKYTFPSKSRIALTLDEVKAIDLGEPVRIIIEDMSLGQDDFYTDDAVSSDMAIALEDGVEDGDEVIDTYLIPTWGSETVLNVLGRYFPHATDGNGMMTAIWTPEYRSDTPGWCQAPRRPTDQPSKVVWCKHTLSTAEWWNVYTDGLGDGAEGFQATPAAPGATALFRFNADSDLDGFSDRSEERLGTDAHDASSSPRPEVLAGVHSIRSGNHVTSTLSLLNSGVYDAYGVEAVMVAPDDSITIENNTVGGSGRVRALQQVIVGSRIQLPTPLPAGWQQANHAVPAAGGYYTGAADRTYTFTVSCGTAGGCKVGEGSWTLGWSDGKGGAGSLGFGAGYSSPTFQAVGGLGVTVALYSGSVQNGESFTVAATTPRDTFQYTVNREPYTPPLVIVSYNDPQGNHRFVIPRQAMSLPAPTENLQPYAGQMLEDVGVELVTSTPFALGVNQVDLLVNNPADVALQNAHLFLEMINVTGTVVSEVATAVTLPAGPTYTRVSFDSGSFAPAFNADEDYIVMAFLTDYQGNILDTTGRPLSSFQVDPRPAVAVNAAPLTWDFGSVAQGALLQHELELANVGYGSLYTYLAPAPGLSLGQHAAVVGAGDLADYELVLRTAELPVGAYDQTTTIATSDPAQPQLTVHVQGNVTAAVGDTVGGLQRPLDVPVTVSGPRSQGEWVEYTHTLGPDPQSLHPVKVYSPDYATLHGVGKYATDFGQGTASYDMFGDGRDGVMPGSGNLDNNNGAGIAIVNSGSAGSTNINVTDASSGWRINPGDAVLIHQTQGAGAGCWEMNKAVSDYVGGTATIQMLQPLKCSYASGGNNHAQMLRVPQYTTCNVTGTVTPLYAWNGNTGGIFAVMCNGTLSLSGAIVANGGNGGTASDGFPGGGSGAGFRGGQGDAVNNDSYGCGHAGEGTPGVVDCNSHMANGNGGAAGSGNPQVGNYGTGGGGGNGTAGGNSTSGGIGVGGSPAGNAELTNMVFGGGGGGSNDNPGNSIGGGGGGGGIVVLLARAATISGSIQVNGGQGGGNKWAAGGGAGGSVLVRSEFANLGVGRISAVGGAARQSGGAGSVGRIRAEYCESFSGSTNPVASTQKLNCYAAEQIEMSPFSSGRLNLPETFTGSRTYAVQYGRKVGFGAGSSQTTTLRIGAGMVASATVDALVSQLSAAATLALDVGADGVDEWSGTVANNSTNPSPDLAAAFNAYWLAQGAPVAGTLDVPVRVTLAQSGQVLLTNLQVMMAGSRERTLRLAAGTVSTATLDLALGGSGAQAVSVAVDVGADGSLDWMRGFSTTLPVRLTVGSMATALNTWLAGKSGVVDVPVRIFVTPDVPVQLYDAAVTMQPVADLRPNGLRAGSAGTAYAAGDIVPLSATVSNPGRGSSGPLTVAFFAYAEGWGDWYVGSDIVGDLASGASAPVAVDWDTLGFSGAVTVTAVVNPYRSTGETSYANNSVTTTVQVNVCAAGDVSCDGSINVLDLQRQINMILHATPQDTALYPLEEWKRADLDGNLTWNVLDLQRLINLIQNQ